MTVSRNAQAERLPTWVGARGFEPPTFCSQNRGRDRRRWQRVASIENCSRSGGGIVQRFADVGSKFEEFCSYFAPGTGASHERQACGGSTCRPTLRHRGRPHPTSLRSDGLQALRARNPRAHPHPERRSRRPGGLGVVPGCLPTRMRQGRSVDCMSPRTRPETPVSTAGCPTAASSPAAPRRS